MIQIIIGGRQKVLQTIIQELRFVDNEDGKIIEMDNIINQG